MNEQEILTQLRKSGGRDRDTRGSEAGTDRKTITGTESKTAAGKIST